MSMEIKEGEMSSKTPGLIPRRDLKWQTAKFGASSGKTGGLTRKAAKRFRTRRPPGSPPPARGLWGASRSAAPFQAPGIAAASGLSGCDWSFSAIQASSSAEIGRDTGARCPVQAVIGRPSSISQRWHVLMDR